MRVLFPFVGDSIGGSHNSIIELYRILRSSSITPIFVLHKIGPLSELLDSLNIQYKYINVKSLAGESPSIFKIIMSVTFNFFRFSKFIRKNKIDIVHGNDLRVNLTWSLPTRLSGSIYIWHQRSVMSSSALWKTSNILADHFVTTSNYVHRSLPNNVKKSKKTLVINPFNVDNFFQQETSRQWLNVLYNIPKQSVLLGYIGRLVDWKNVDFLIYCFAECLKRFDLNLHLIIVGTGRDEYEDSLKQLVWKLEINTWVTFAGFNSEPSRVISALDLMIAPSNKEPFGRTIIEAMIQKTPVIAAKGGGHIETVKHRETGWLYSHGDIQDFIAKLKEILNEQKMADNIVQRAYIHAHSKYSSTRHVEKMISIYNQLY